MAATAVLPRATARVTPVLAAAMVLAVVAAGCSRNGHNPPPPEPTSSATVATTPAVDPVAVPSGTVFADTTQEYAESAVAAWAAPDLIRLAELAIPAVHEQIIEVPGPPNQAWTFIRCEQELTRSACSFHNAEGDHLMLTVLHRLLGKPQAVVAAVFEPTAYPDDALAYVAAFVEAWQAGNPPRMANLAVAAAAEAVQQLPPAPQASYEVGETDGRMVTVLVVLTDPADAEFEAELQAQVHTGLVGEPQAIRQVTLPEQ